MANGKNKDEWDDLDDAEGANKGISPELARAVLATNPSLRDGGMTTDLLVKQRGPQTAGKTDKAKAPANIAGASLVDTAKQLEKRLNDAKSKRDKDVADAEARFVAERKATLDSLVQWLGQNDPELRSPFTQQALEQKKALLTALGFDVKAYVASRMKR